MNQNVAPLRVFKVSGPRVAKPILVIENVERGDFKFAGAFGIDETFLAEASGTASADKYTFCALDALRKHGLYGDHAGPPQQMPRSIDEAADQAADQDEARMRERVEFEERWRREHPTGESEQKEVPARPAGQLSGVGKDSGPVIIGEWRELSLEEQRQIEDKARAAYQGSVELRARQTPRVEAGRPNSRRLRVRSADRGWRRPTVPWANIHRNLADATPTLLVTRS